MFSNIIALVAHLHNLGMKKQNIYCSTFVIHQADITAKIQLITQEFIINNTFSVEVGGYTVGQHSSFHI